MSPIYGLAARFSGGFAGVKTLDGKLWFIDLTGNRLKGVVRKVRAEDRIIARACGGTIDDAGGVSLSDDYHWRKQLMHGNIEKTYIEISQLNPNYWLKQDGAYEPTLPTLQDYCPSAVDAWQKSHRGGGYKKNCPNKESINIYPDPDLLIPIQENCGLLGYLWGYRDRAVQVVIKPQFSWAGRFSEGLARVLAKPSFQFLRGPEKPLWDFVDGSGKWCWK